MATAKPTALLKLEYEESAEAYLRGLPPEHFMESPAQATQRKITLESLDLVAAQRPEVQVFNELLVQYPHPQTGGIRKVVPDNLVVLWAEPLKLKRAFHLPLQPARPFWVLEYVSKESKRKDYEENFKKYERELKVPYYLTFYPDDQELTLFRRGRAKYASVKPNAQGRYPLPQLGLEVALLDEWVRFWLEGELLPLPADLQRDLDRLRQERDRLARQLGQVTQERDGFRQELGDVTQERDGLARQLGDVTQERDSFRRELEAMRAELGRLRRGRE
jgi:Uma2 family endonuclease